MRKLLTFRDLLGLIPDSEATLRRRIADSRAGIGNFPKPVDDGYKKKLLFRPEDIEAWAAGGHQQQPVRNIESARQRQRRHTAAMKSLTDKGVTLPSQKQEPAG